MSDNPTEQQYALGVEIGHAVVKAMEDGASYDDVLATLQHTTELMRRNQAMGVTFGKKAA